MHRPVGIPFQLLVKLPRFWQSSSLTHVALYLDVSFLDRQTNKQKFRKKKQTKEFKRAINLVTRATYLIGLEKIGHDEHRVVLVGWNDVVGRVEHVVAHVRMQREQVLVEGELVDDRVAVERGVHGHVALAFHFRCHDTRDRVECLIAFVVNELPTFILLNLN